MNAWQKRMLAVNLGAQQAGGGGGGGGTPVSSQCRYLQEQYCFLSHRLLSSEPGILPEENGVVGSLGKQTDRVLVPKLIVSKSAGNIVL